MRPGEWSIRPVSQHDPKITHTADEGLNVETSRCLPFFHPTRVAFIDDEISFLSILLTRLQLGLPVTTYNSPRTFLADLEQEHVTANLDTDWWGYYLGMADSPVQSQVISLNKSKIYQQAFDKRRFDTISVVVVDYDMPDMSGLALCRELADLPCKKILLTGHTDSAMVSRAFKQGLIDLYLPKFHPRLELELTTAIRHFQHQYMTSATEMFARRLRATDPVVWSDRAFSRFFQRFCTDRGVVEFYAVDDPRGFLLLDKAARGRLMLIHTSADIDAQRAIAEASRAPSTVISALRSKQRVLHFPHRQPPGTLTPHQWGTSCIRAYPFPGRKDRYYALIDNPGPFRVSPDTVLGFDQYLRMAG